ncbi:hypothetical protein [Rubrivirga sp. IMCC43871]|uniref:hypothetical protein n=1 Tax=Rubrivirga sp. IMCC43871 TaxID=3391575 RepID=UPI00398FDEB6
MTIPEPHVTTDEVRRGIDDGRQYWALRGNPPGRVELFHAELDVSDPDEEPFPLIHYSGGYWMDSSGEEGTEEFDDYVESFGLHDVLWHETDLGYSGEIIAFDVHRYLGLPDPD